MERNAQELEQIVGSAAAETLEHMAFMMVEPADPDQPAADLSDAVKASQLILEPHPGELRLIMPRRLAAEIAATMFSCNDSEISDGMLADVVMELLNTMAGDIMKRLLPQDHTFALGLPELGEEAFITNSAPTCCCSFQSQGLTFCLVAFLEPFVQYGTPAGG